MNGNVEDKAAAMESLLKELTNPHQNINQHFMATCTCTSMSFDLAAMKPAEYARIVTDLLTTGQSKLANGETIHPPINGFGYDQTNRSAGERLMQSALMNYAKNGQYSNDKSDDGLYTDQEVKVLSAITGKQYDVVMDNKEGTLRNYLDGGRGPVYADFGWGDGGHAVAILKVEDDRVYFRNPWGGHITGVSDGVGIPDAKGQPLKTDPSGNLYTPSGPSRRVVDSANGIESISILEFQQITSSLLVEHIAD